MAKSVCGDACLMEGQETPVGPGAARRRRVRRIEEPRRPDGPTVRNARRHQEHRPEGPALPRLTAQGTAAHPVQAPDRPSHDGTNRRVFWASHSRIPEIVELARKIRRRRPDILRTIELGYSNARLGAFNNRIKVTVRMAYGFRRVTNLIALVMPRCSGLDIRLPQPAI